LDERGEVQMVNVGNKMDTNRRAVAKGYVEMQSDTLSRIQNHQIQKGNVLTTAKIAGIMASKQTSSLIPLCHPLQITKSDVEFEFDEEKARVHVISTVKCFGKTGVEMEALMAVSVACCTIYDMCKAIDKTMVISNILVTEKKGTRIS
jgi:cyclic pyranopterin phosphate synthase